MKRTLLCFAGATAILIEVALVPTQGSASPTSLVQDSEALTNDCVNVEVRQFYPGQAGSEMYYVTNNCGTSINLDFATKGMPSQLSQLSPDMGQFTGWSGHVPSPYKFWYCPAPQFPSDPQNNPLNGPTYEADHVVCRN